MIHRNKLLKRSLSFNVQVKETRLKLIPGSQILKVIGSKNYMEDLLTSFIDERQFLNITIS